MILIFSIIVYIYAASNRIRPYHFLPNINVRRKGCSAYKQVTSKPNEPSVQIEQSIKQQLKTIYAITN